MDSEEKTPLEIIMEHYSISQNDLKRWLKMTVTQVFFKCINVERDVCDDGMHKAITMNSMPDALLEEGGHKTCERILDFPEILSEHIKAEKTDGK